MQKEYRFRFFRERMRNAAQNAMRMIGTVGMRAIVAHCRHTAAN
jgi:hypothetical protein